MDVSREVFRPPGECMNTDKKENKRMRDKMKQQDVIEGKTKTLETFMNDKLVRITTKDSLTANDGELMKVLKVAEYKTTQTCDVFELLARNKVPVAYLERENLRTFFAKKCRMIPIECVIRRQPHGSYLKRHPEKSSFDIFDPLLTEFFHKNTVVMPCTVHKNQHAINEETRLIPEDKAREYFMDENEGWNHEVYTDPLIERGEKEWYLHPPKGRKKDKPLYTILPLLTEEAMKSIESLMRTTFSILEDAWKTHKVSLIDMKIEMGYTIEDGQLVVADVIDNDSWRIWPHGDPKRQLDKQSFREGETDDAVVEKYRVVTEYTKQWERNT